MFEVAGLVLECETLLLVPKERSLGLCWPGGPIGCHGFQNVSDPGVGGKIIAELADCGLAIRR